MHGVPTNLDLEFLHGAELIQVCIGQHQMQFHFHPTGTISVEAGWELLDYAGIRVDGAQHGPNRPAYHVHRLLGQKVASSEVNAPEWFALHFESGDVLRMFDDSKEHESFSIKPGDIFV